MGHVFSQYQKNDGEADHVAFSGGNVQVITTKNKWKEKLAEAKSAGKIVIANFSAIWCGSCKMIEPYYRELSENYPSLMFLTVDIDKLPSLVKSWKIEGAPTFLFLSDGRQFDKVVGANKSELQSKITALADLSAPI